MTATSSRFLPAQEAALDTWLLHFTTKISADPAAYALTAGDAAIIAGAVDKWHKAFETASALATRTRGTVIAKREEKKNVTAIVRGYAARVRANETLDDALKVNLGLKLRAPRGSPVPVPSTFPTLAVVSFQPGLHTLRAVDVGTRPSRGKPPGVASVLVYRAVGGEPAPGPASAEFLTLSTRVAFTSTFIHAQHGQTATYFARWINTKGEAGPWGTATIVPVAA